MTANPTAIDLDALAADLESAGVEFDRIGDHPKNIWRLWFPPSGFVDHDGVTYFEGTNEVRDRIIRTHTTEEQQ